MIEILAESSGNAVGVRLSGRVSATEYRDFLAPAVNRAVEVHGRYRLLLVLADDLQGFSEGVLLDDPDYGLKHRGYLLERLAVVGGDERLHAGVALAGHFASERMKTYAAEALPAAWAWVREHVPAEDAIVSAHALLGAKVVDSLNQPLGQVEDLLVDESTGSIRLVVLGFGGVLGLGEKLFPFPWRLVHVRGDGSLQLKLHEIDKSREQLEQAPHVERGHVWRPAQSFSFSMHPFFGGAKL